MKNIKLKGLLDEKYTNTFNEGNNETVKLSREEKSEFLKRISEYNKFGKALYNENDLVDISNSLSGIAEAASRIALEETGNSFDGITINRNMTELKKLSEQFTKYATEAKSFKQRLSALYEEMGHILGRYYDINEDDDNII